MRRNQTRSPFFAVLVAGVAAVTLLWSMAAQPDEEMSAPDFGGAYVEGIAGAPGRVNPLFVEENETDQAIAALVFAGLTGLDKQGTPFPDMAETWRISPDGRTYTFTLRLNLFWHDGKPLKAGDVLFTYELLRSPEVPIPPRLTALLGGAEISAPDDRTVVVALEEPYAALPAYLTLGILPRHHLEGLTMAEVYNSFFNQQPIGSGPYRLVRLTPSEADLAANPNYHLEQPFIQRLELRFYRDEGALHTAIEAGEVTAAMFAGNAGQSGQIALEVKQDLRVTPVDTGEITYVYFNLNRPVFADRRVRQALLYALDRDAIVLDTLGGKAAKAQSPVPPSSWAYSPALTRYETDVKLASLLLDDAGWLRGPDGFRRRDGEALAFTLVTNVDPVRLAVAEHIAEAWNRLGLQVDVSAVGVTELVRNRMEPRDYDAALWARVPAVDPDPYEQWHSSQSEGEGANLTGLADERIDAVLEEARTVPQAHRRELYQEFQELFAQEVPAIPLYVSTASYVQPAALKGVRVALVREPGDRFWQVQEWFLKTR